MPPRKNKDDEQPEVQPAQAEPAPIAQPEQPVEDEPKQDEVFYIVNGKKVDPWGRPVKE